MNFEMLALPTWVALINFEVIEIVQSKLIKLIQADKEVKANSNFIH